jgi:diamine N-acetyltransferase
MVDLFDFDAINSRVGVGIIITDANARNNGFAEETLNMIINYTKNTLFINQIHCSIHSYNTKSINLFTKIGFQFIGTRIKWYKKGQNQWSDENLYQLIL